MQLQQTLQTPRSVSDVETSSNQTVDVESRELPKSEKRDVRIEIDLETQQRVIVLPEVDARVAANAPTQIRPGRLLVLPSSEPRIPAFSHFIDARWLHQWRAHRSTLRSVMLTDRPLLETVIADVALKRQFGTFVELAPFVSATTLDWLQGLTASGATPSVELHVSDAAVGYEFQRLTSRFVRPDASSVHRSWVEQTPRWTCGSRPRLLSWLGVGIGELNATNRIAALHRLHSAANIGDWVVLGVESNSRPDEFIDRYQSVAISQEVLDREHVRVRQGNLTTPLDGTYEMVWNDEIDAFETRIVGRGRTITCSQRFAVGVDELSNELHGSGFAVRRVYGTSRDRRRILLAEIK